MTEDRVARFLALLNAGVQKYEVSGQAHDSLKPSDVAMAMAMLPGRVTRLLQQKFLNEDHTENLTNELIGAFQQQCSLERRKPPMEKTLRRLSSGAVHYFCFPTHCSLCRGGGKVWNRRAQEVDCSQCLGTGRKVLSANYVHTLTGVDKRTLRTRHLRTFNELLSLLARWEAYGAGEIRRKLRRD